MEKHVTADQIYKGCDLPKDSPLEIIEQISVLLPTQGSITDFVHHNTLHAFQSMDFYQAVDEAAKIYGSTSTTKGFFQPQDGILVGGLRRSRNIRIRMDTEEAVNSFMIRISSAFFDQGVAATSMPYTNLGIWGAVQQLNRESFLPIGPISHRKTQKLLKKSSAEALQLLLSILVDDKTLYPRFLTEVILSLKGWAGFCRMVENEPTMLERKRPAVLSEWVTLYLLAEFNALISVAGLEAIRITDQDRDSADIARFKKGAQNPTGQSDLEAAERAAYTPILKHLATQINDGIAPVADIQAIFCIDDREFSFRRFLEKESAKIETFGAPGFFAMDFQMSEGNSKRPVKLCPPIAKSNVSIAIEHTKTKHNWLYQLFWSGGSQTLLRGWFITQLIGIPMGFRFLASLIAPGFFSKRRLSGVEHQKSKLHLFQEAVVPRVKTQDLGHTQAGYTVNDAAIRVKSFLDTIGFPEECAKVVAIVGHGASSANNPYFAAYDCGACSGRPGSYNARAFCELANNNDVRQLMAAAGRTIPSETIFVPFLHDTTADHLQVLTDTTRTVHQKQLLNELELAMAEAAMENAAFRCRQFDHAPWRRSAKAAARHVKIRALAWYEPRPEYNHATNIAAIIGPRRLSKTMESEATIFLNSYEPAEDNDGSKLSKILGAVVPVCGGINLEYFFSRIEPEIYGAGNKLPQNVVGMIGVMTGLESDLRTGLPRQMTEIHDPRRLLIIACQKKEIVDVAVNSSAEVRQWIENGWVHLVSHDPDSRAQFIWTRNQWKPWN